MISTQVLAEKRGILDNATSGQSTSYFTVEQCNQIANISKRTIKAAISGVPIAEVIEKFGGIDTGGESLILPAVQNIVENTVDSKMDSYNPGKGASYNPGKGASIQEPRSTSYVPDGRNDGKVTVIQKDISAPADMKGTKIITAIYKTVDQIKTKYGQVRPQDIARLNNRAEQKLIESRKTAGTAEGMYIDDASSN